MSNHFGWGEVPFYPDPWLQAIVKAGDEPPAQKGPDLGLILIELDPNLITSLIHVVRLLASNTNRRALV